MTSGLLIVIGSTSVLSIIFIFVKDMYTGIIKDFSVTPISYIKIIYSYFLAAFIISMIITLLIYIFIELFFISYYHNINSFKTIFYSILIITSSNIISSLLILIIALFINNFNSFATFQTLYGVVIGFFTGVYIPIGYYPTIIRNIFFYFPLCQTTSLLRNINTHNITNNILKNYPTNIHHILYETFGIIIPFNNFTISSFKQIQMIILLNLILIFLLNFRKYHK